MHEEVEALLALQDDDLKIREIESQIRALDPQLAEFDRRRQQANAALARAETALTAEEKKRGELQARLAQHKQMQERNLHQLDDVKRMREATAATAQDESTRRLMAEDESEIAILGRRITEMMRPSRARSRCWPTSSRSRMRPDRKSKRRELRSGGAGRRTEDVNGGPALCPSNARQVRPDQRQENEALYALARWIVRQLRYVDPAPAPEHDGGKRRDRGV